MPHSLAVNFFPHWWHKERGRADLSARVIAADLSECVDLLLNGCLCSVVGGCAELGLLGRGLHHGAADGLGLEEGPEV